MQEQSTQFKITNTTRWPGTKKGKHRLGFILQINRRHLQPNQHIYVGNITEGIENMQKRRFVRVEEVKDRRVEVSKALQEQERINQEEIKKREAELKAQQAQESKALKIAKDKEKEDLNRAQENSDPASGLDKDAMKDAIRNSNNKAHVSQEGDYMNSLQDAVDPDPQDNFTVQAGQGKSKRNKNKNKNN